MTLTPEQEAELQRLLARRLSGEPLQYILGEWSFMGLDFYVNPYALIPRQDTETLVEKALELAEKLELRTALDVCTGTGCIAVSLKKLGRFTRVAASDISYECMALAGENARRSGVDIELYVRDLLEGHGSYDLITANPPYIADAELPLLQEEVRHEPRLALSGGADGLDFYRRIAQSYKEHLSPGGVLLMEVGAGQAASVAELFAGCETELVRDINGIERVVTVRRRA